MKRGMIPLMIAVLISVVQVCWGQATQNKSQLNWLTSYEEAVNQAKAQSKPMILLFTATVWCPACKQLEEDVLKQAAFAEAVGNEFVFLRLDFSSPQRNPQNEQLKSKYSVRSYPTIIMLDTNQQQVGITGIRPGGARPYASHLLQMWNEYKNYSNKKEKLDQHQTLSGADLKKIFEKARELHLDNDLAAIIAAGLNSDQKPYFLMERFRMLAEEGRVHDAEAQDLRQQLLSLDPTNASKTHYQLAVIEFEAYSAEMDKENYSPDLACSPLTAYIEKFGNQDKENLWRLEMIISQVYLDKDKLAQALKYAQSSYEVAPAAVQPDIALAIQDIQARAR